MKLNNKLSVGHRYKYFAKYVIGLECKKIKKVCNKILSYSKFGVYKEYTVNIPPRNNQVQIRAICALFRTSYIPKQKVLIYVNKNLYINVVNFFHRISKDWDGPEWQGTKLDCKIDFSIKKISKNKTYIVLPNKSVIEIITGPAPTKQYNLGLVDTCMINENKKLTKVNRTIYFNEVSRGKPLEILGTT